MRYTEGVYKRKRNGKIVYDGVLAYYDEHGKRKFAHRERKTQYAAREALRKLRNELEEPGPKALENNVVTFAQLADYCDRKSISKRSTTARVKNYVALEMRVRTNHASNISARTEWHQRPDAPSTAARELQTLRAMLYEAKRNQWIKQNPFEFARKNEVIKASDRKKRNLFLTFGDEIKLLRACETEDRRHLRALIIVAVDPGARFGELIHLKKAQVDFTGSGTIYGLLNYKDLGGDKQTRNAKMTPRVREALLDVINNPPAKAFKVQRGKKPSAELVFGTSNNVRTAWAGALEEAGLTHLGLHFHDLRHTPGTRVKKMVDLVDIANALGHKDPKTTAQIYINHTDEDLIDFARAVEQAVEAGYRQAMLEDVRPDLESGLIS